MYADLRSLSMAYRIGDRAWYVSTTVATLISYSPPLAIYLADVVLQRTTSLVTSLIYSTLR